MSNMELTRDGAVHILTLTNGGNANTLTAEVLDEYHAALDKLEALAENLALLVTSSDAKFFCNGINLEWIATQPPDYFPRFASLLDRLYLRFALADFPVVGCLTGHTYAGGALLAATFDFRFMREERGFFCLPEVDIKIPFSPVMHEILRLFPDGQAAGELLLTGKRIGGREAKEMKIVHEAYPEQELFAKALELARFLAAKDRKTYGSIKRGIRRHLVDVAREPAGPSSPS
ncbi:MAG: enoyl-CoA hydratase/isomerase family protein [Smithellaceae bacterium]|nr:enoyl-CoA hydratase/isomerase family protein [Smithellaceae bacterium]